MKLVDINWHPTDVQLRQFGCLCTVALPLLGWFFRLSAEGIASLLAIGLVAAVMAWVWPTVLRPLYVALIVLTAPLGMIVGELAMLSIYFGIFLPIGVAFRLMHRDALQRKMERKQKSYWQDKPQPANATEYFRRY